MPSKCLNAENTNPNLKVMEFGICGSLAIRAAEIEKELQKGFNKPFDQVIKAYKGDAHAMGQKPITFLRQVLVLVLQPDLMDSTHFPEDAKEHARIILKGCEGSSLGSYTQSEGIEVIRRQVADFITERDGFKCNWQDVILTAGASSAIKAVIQLLNCKINSKPPGILIPIPQYPVYSATIAEYGLEPLGYYLDGSKNWSLDIAELKRVVDASRAKGITPRALVIINPGNPTGQVLDRDNIAEIVKFAYKEKLFLMADEVYQDNVYGKNVKFHSFKKVLSEMGAPFNNMELVSFMSASKGYLGECGLRGGLMELINVSPKIKDNLLNSMLPLLCPTTAGQVAISVLVNPPKPNEPSYEKFISEKNAVLNSLKERAELVYQAFRTFEGYRCYPVQGALYAFPQITIPPKAIEAAKKAGQTPDNFYVTELLESTGIFVIAGSGFGQKAGTYHFRTTILPQIDQLKVMLGKLKEFHVQFMEKYK